MSSEQKEALNSLLRVHLHQQITQEIRKELMNSKSRDVIVVEETPLPVPSSAKLIDAMDAD